MNEREKRAANFGKTFGATKISSLKPEPLWGAALGGGAGLLAGHLTRDKDEDASTLKNLGRTAMYGLGGAALGTAGGAAYPEAKQQYAKYLNKKQIHKQINDKMQALMQHSGDSTTFSNPAMANGF